jgi:hypothetical protein
VERAGVSGQDPLPHDTRLAGGLSGTLAGILQVKLEGQHYLGASPGTRATPGFSSFLWYGQLVAVF